jgi:hypothetical protein
VRHKAISRGLVLLTLLAVAASQSTTGIARLAGAPKYFFAITPPVDDESFSSLTKDYQTLKHGGASWVRFRVDWGSIQPHQGARYHWSTPNNLFAAAACTGLRPLPLILGAPTWATAKQKTKEAPPTPRHRGDWGRFVRALVTRYGVNGTYWQATHKCANGTVNVPKAPSLDWEIWNEPDIPAYWNGNPSPANYALLLWKANQAIKSVNPTAKTVMSAPRNVTYLKHLYNTSQLNANFNIFDIHPYSRTPVEALKVLRDYRTTVNAQGASDKLFWVSEIGWASCKQARHGYPPRCAKHELATTEAGQRRKLIDMYKRFTRASAWLKLQRVAWYGWVDPRKGDASCLFCIGTGLFHRNGTSKPAWAAFTRLAGGKP